jgi:hypothetical protein
MLVALAVFLLIMGTGLFVWGCASIGERLGDRMPTIESGAWVDTLISFVLPIALFVAIIIGIFAP